MYVEPMLPHSSSTWAREEVKTSPSCSFHMIRIEGGTFRMGDNNGTFNREKPSHPVQLDSFWIGQHLVPQSLWKEIMGENPAHFRGLSRPVERVSWHDCIAFCNALSKKLGHEPVYEIIGKSNVHINRSSNGFRLPTEAEWEYAARGGKYMNNNLRYPGSKSIEKVAWYRQNSASHSHPNSMKVPNSLGLFDVSGNLREWCWDYFGSDYYQASADLGTTENPLGPKSGVNRVIRGGSWYDDASYCRVAYRRHGYPVYRGHDRGLRLARTAM